MIHDIEDAVKKVPKPAFQGRETNKFVTLSPFTNQAKFRKPISIAKPKKFRTVGSFAKSMFAKPPEFTKQSKVCETTKFTIPWRS